MGLRAGTLNHRVTIEQLTAAQDTTSGVVVDQWSTFHETWANVRPVSGKEFIAAGIENSKIVATIRVRYMPGIRPSMRVRHREQTYNIEAVLPDHVDGRGWLTLPVSEVQNG